MRILLYLATNLAVVVVLGVVMRLFGVEAWLMSNGIDANLGGLLIFAAGFGFLGSFISLAMSKSIAKWTTRAQVIEHPRSPEEAWLVETVQQLSSRAGIGMPEVAVYPAMEPNAFATGMRKNAALVAVSEGLLRGMNRREVEAVLAHEVSHVANGDMVTMSLLQGVLNTFVIFMSRLVGGIIDSAMGNREGRGIGYWVTVIALEIIFGILASIIVAAFSRYREYRADAGAAALMGSPQPMQSALASLERLSSVPSQLPEQMAAFGIRGGGKGLLQLFRSHPPIPDRIEALGRLDEGRSAV